MNNVKVLLCLSTPYENESRGWNNSTRSVLKVEVDGLVLSAHFFLCKPKESFLFYCDFSLAWDTTDFFRKFLLSLLAMPDGMWMLVPLPGMEPAPPAVEW